MRKIWIAIFICLQTKAIDLQVVPDMTADAFIGALKTFCAVCGYPSRIFSDNGTNFKAASRKLHEFAKLLRKEKGRLVDETENKAIQWQFTPPLTPHFGGIWESNIRRFKESLHKTYGTGAMTADEWQIAIKEIESCLNSRPLTTTENGGNLLTPGHFLIGRAIRTLQIPQPTQRTQSIQVKWKNIQEKTEYFWNLWQTSYLSTLQTRSKWNKTKGEQLHIGDLVAMKQEMTTPTDWKLGIIVDTKPGADGIVRVVSVKYGQTVVDRSVLKLVKVLENNVVHESDSVNGGD